MHTQNRARRVAGRLGVAVLGALVLAVAGPVGVAAAAPTSITISPQDPTGVAGQATEFSTADENGQDVTAGTTFTITPDGSCTANRCTPARPGQHTVTAANGTARASTTLRVPDRLPVAAPDRYTTPAGTPLTVDAPGVLGNDTDADGDPLTAAVVATTSDGTLTLNPNGSLRYVPNPGFSGNDRFTYRASDGRPQGFSSATTVTITVGAAPTETLTISPATATGAVGQPQTYTASQDGADVTSSTTFAITPDGSCTANVCTPAAPGGHQVTGRKGLALDTATLEVTNRLPVAVDDAYSVASGAVLTVPAPGVLANDSDPDPGTTLTALAFAQPAHGTLALAPDGGFVYTPTPGYVGPDSFTYRARDGRPQGSAQATVTLTVTRPTGPPRADVAIRLAGTPTAAGTFPLTVTTTNNGPFAANQVTTAVRLPAGLRIVSAPGGIVARDGSSVAYLNGTVPAGRAVTATITVRVVTAGGRAPITAAAVSPTRDPVILNNVAVLAVR